MPEKRTQNFPLVLSAESRAALVKVAELQQRPVADVIRDAISSYLHSLGIDVDATVTRGGYRERQKKS